jgi:hypothetical protein
MVKFLSIGLVILAASLAASAPADARGGCGIGRHHGALGICVDNEGVPPGRACPLGWHLGPAGHCRRN